MSAKRPAGPLVIIGGAEDRQGDRVILNEFVRLAGRDKARIVVMTCATQHPVEVGAEYKAVFTDLGVGDVRTVDIEERDQANEPEAIQAIEQATGVFFTGGDQVRITTLLGGSHFAECLFERHGQGLVIAGTSAGAAVMATVMILKGDSRATASIETVKKGPGMGFVDEMIIDMHFSQRGRIGRLIAAIAEHPGFLGLGIDENTAVILHRGEFEVLGDGAVTIIDASQITYTNADQYTDEHIMAICGLRLHVLPAPYRFDLRHRLPIIPGNHHPSQEQ